MRDYSGQSKINQSKTKNKTGSKAGGWIKVLVKVGVGLLILILIIFAACWLFLPKIMGTDQSLNLVLVGGRGKIDGLEEFGGEEGFGGEEEPEFRLIYLRPQTGELIIEKVSSDLSVRLVEDDEIKEISLKQAYASANQAKAGQSREEAFFSWALEREIHQVFEVVQAPDSLEELRRVFRQKAVAKNWQAWPIYFYARQVGQAEYSEFSLSSRSPSTNNQLIEQCSAAVLNSTQISGLAAKVNTILENSSWRVIRVDSFQAQSEQALPKTTVFFESSSPCQPLVERLSQIFPSDLDQNSDSDRAKSLINRYRADVVVILGEDLSFN